MTPPCTNLQPSATCTTCAFHHLPILQRPTTTCMLSALVHSSFYKSAGRYNAGTTDMDASRDTYAQSLRKYTPPPSLAQTREIILSVTGRSLLGGTASVTICAANLQTSTVPHFPQCTFCLLSHCLKYNRDVSSLFVGVNAPDLIAPRITRVQNSRSESG
jgi:hypothetical protein